MMHSWKRRLQNHRGMEFALFYLVLLFGVGAYQTIKVFMNIDLYSEQVLFGLSSHSFIAALLFFWAVVSIFWITALRVLDWAHRTSLTTTKNALFGSAVLFLGVPIGISIQIYSAMAFSPLLSSITEALLITTIISFAIGISGKYRKTA
ncbi:hypothetical protein [Fictibacillus enclensis]|uniref:hypothetical protein n=2 Tax=Fictibacillus TaxID=1329200 RepID=UPI0010105C60|nr:hypothetical protein [Fictibacillus enclensis]WHY73540.1 hypothetical protein QNH15_06400 [Fictibacillus enclensis]